jgi:deoxyribodipyrimidine photo-lyase
MLQPIAVHWFRRDLRPEDNAALFHALKSGFPVQCIFIFDRHILDELVKGENGLYADRRVQFIHQALTNLKARLRKLGSDLKVYYGFPLEVWKQIISEYNIAEVFTNHDYEPYANKRDAEVAELLKYHSIRFSTFKDQCIFEKGEVLKDDGLPYTVFTPYSRKWKAKLSAFYLRSYPNENYFQHFLKVSETSKMPALEEMGFKPTVNSFPEMNPREEVLSKYGSLRNFPAIRSTSRLGVHLRFGTISIRQLARKAFERHYETFLNELIWRDFYMMILAHFPHVVDRAFKPEYDKIAWRNNEDDFRKWCEGKTGYPIVDAGMRELNETGFMHNRVRMIVASFLTKHLLIDWRRGEAYFAKHLLDFELSSNNGGWQWAAGSGCDAAPYFRVFNPALQTEKFDPQGDYIRQWVKEFDTMEYPAPIVDHAFARKRALETYAKAVGKQSE